MPDPLIESCRDLLEGQYDCVDRIVLNAYFPLAQKPGGFRTWWRQLRGSDRHLDDTHLMRLAGRFGRRVRALAKARGIPVVFCPAGMRKDEVAQVLLNGHEHVACQTSKKGIALTQEQNCFTQAYSFADLEHVAETLSEQRTIGRLRRVCERWIYTCLSLALDSEDQTRSGFQYQYSVYQMEYTATCCFRRATP